MKLVSLACQSDRHEYCTFRFAVGTGKTASATVINCINSMLPVKLHLYLDLYNPTYCNRIDRDVAPIIFTAAGFTPLKVKVFPSVDPSVSSPGTELLSEGSDKIGSICCSFAYEQSEIHRNHKTRRHSIDFSHLLITG
jgi:hypothetical protein